MPFQGPEGQGPFSSFEDCVSSMSDEEGIDDPEGICAVWMRQAEKLDQDTEELLALKDKLGLTQTEFMKVLALLEEEQQEVGTKSDLGWTTEESHNY